MRVFRWLLTMYLVAAFLACLLVYLGDAHDVAIGRWADSNEHLLYVVIPLAVVLVIPGQLAVDGGNLGHMLLVFAAAIVEVATLYALVAFLRSLVPSRPS